LPTTGQLSKVLEVDFIKEDMKKERELDPNVFSIGHFKEIDDNSVDILNRVREYGIFYREFEKSKRYGYNLIRDESMGTRVNLTRPRKGNRHDYIIMGSNDYLGLGAHPEVIAAAKKALDIYGFGSTGSPMTTGLTKVHMELCERLAQLHQKESCLLFNSGYAVNVGTLPGILRPGDLVVTDQLCHASIQDGLQMARATSRYFKHNNIDHLEQILEKEREAHNGCLVVTEGIFSMDGDIAKLDEIYRVARKYDARVFVDQAHDFGVIGPRGLGVCDKFNLMKEIDIIMGTFSKICGGIGGFVVGSKDLINWYHAFARSQTFSVSIPPSTAAAMLKALDVFTRDRTLVDSLQRNIAHFVRGLESIGFTMPANHESSIVPVVIGDQAKMGEMFQSLLDDGIMVVPIIYPAVSRTNCRFRFTVMANHSIAELDYAVGALERAMLKANFKPSDAPKINEKKSGDSGKGAA
jgi:8-amino-7-oxononanoate synthase